MKALKIAGIVLAVLIGLILILSLFAPKELAVERSVTIQKSREAIFPHVQSLKKREAWSPWMEMDPNSVINHSGTDGEVGSSYSWEGNEDVGKGEQTLLAIDAPNRVESRIQFIEPMAGEADDWIALEDTEGGTQVTWGFRQKLSFPGNVFMLFAKNQIESMVAADFEKGLSKLKAITEAESAGTGSYDVKEVDYPQRHYLAVRKTISWDEMTDFYGASFGSLMGALPTNGIQPAGAPSGLIYVWDETQQTADMAAGIPVANATELSGFESITLPAGKSLQVDYYGPYDGIGPAHNAIDAYMKEKGLTMKPPVIEEYLTDPGQEPDTSKWLTRVIYLVIE